MDESIGDRLERERQASIREYVEAFMDHLAELEREHPSRHDYPF
jgi:hypothetical protein